MTDNSYDYKLSPRQQFCGSYAYVGSRRSDVCLMLMDTQQEKDIGLAPDYPFEPLKAGECIVPDKFRQIGLAVGEQLEVHIHNGKFLDTAATVYNETESPLVPANQTSSKFSMKIFCTIKDFITESYGKYGKGNVDYQIIMEYNEFYPWANTYLPGKLKRNPGFVKWLSEPQRLEQFAGMLMYVLPGDRTSYYQHSEAATMRK